MKRLAAFLMLFIFLVLSSQSYAFFGFGNKANIQQCQKALDAYVDFLRQNIHRKASDLTEKDWKKIKELNSQAFACKEKIREAAGISRVRSVIRGVGTHLDKIKPGRFAFIFYFPTTPAFVIKKLYDDKVDVFWFDVSRAGGISREKLEKQAEKEKNKKFCIVSPFDLRVTCYPFHLEKEFRDEVVKNCGVKYLNPFSLKASYEFNRLLILWLEKEFGPKGRGLIPSVTEKGRVKAMPVETKAENDSSL